MMNGNIKEWFEEFLKVPGRSGDKPDGRPLYSYQTRIFEYEKLGKLLKSACEERSTAIESGYWSAGFCLFVSEFYRRDYDGGNGGWTWRATENLLGIELDVEQRREITQRGLVRFWKRGIRTGEGGRQFLGTLYAEGGLPWKLVQNERHGFGRVIRSGLKRHDQAVSLGQSLASCIERHAHYLPKSFQNSGTYEMLAAIVVELMRIASAYPEMPKKTDEAVSFLDSRSPGWRRRFPIPLGEANGRELVATWFSDAAREHASSKPSNISGQLTSETLLECSGQWSLVTTVTFPESIDFDLAGEVLSSTRLTLALFEGSHRLESLSSVYAEIDENGQHATARLRQRHCEVLRRSIREPLTLRAFSQGRLISVLMVDSPAEDGDDLPLIFEPLDENEWRWVGSLSTSLRHHVARIFLPDGIEIVKPIRCTELEIEGGALLWGDGFKGKWIDLFESTSIETSSGLVQIRLRELLVQQRPKIEGTIDNRDTLPGLCFQGFPKMVPPAESPLNISDFDITLNAKPITKALVNAFVGIANLSATFPGQGLVLRRRFGVLPENLRVYLQPALTNTPARLLIKTDDDISVGIHGDGFRAILVSDSNTRRFDLLPDRSDFNSLSISINLASDNEVEPVVLRIPFPQVPALLIDADGAEIESNQLSIDSLLGTRLVLSRDGSAHRFSHVSCTLEGRRGRKLEIHQKIEVGESLIVMPLHACREDWMRMLSASADQDDYIRVGVESDRLLRRFTVRRFDAKLKRSDIEGVVVLLDYNQRPISTSAALMAMNVTAPESAPLPLRERVSDIAATGLYELPDETNEGGPWLIYADESSPITVRPYFVRSSESGHPEDALTPLHDACARFDHTLNPTAIDDVIAVMGEDYSHAGWSYLRDLRKNYYRLPLSSFEAWRSVAKSSRALVATLMNLEPDADFAARLVNELAVVWEEIPLQIWNEGVSMLREEKDRQLGDSELTGLIVSSRLSLLVEAIPCFSHFVDLNSGKVRLPSTNSVIHEHVLNLWHRSLLLRHAHNDQWPDLLRTLLQRWYKNQCVVPKPQAFERDYPGYARTVSLLPLFMAAVTAGKASLEELDHDPEAVRFDVRVLADFDRSWYEPVYIQTLALISETEER